MRSVFHWLISIGLLFTPAVLYVAWTLAFDEPYNQQVFEYARSVFAECSQGARLDRSVRCDTFVEYWANCRQSSNGCRIAETYKILGKLEFDPPPLYASTK